MVFLKNFRIPPVSKQIFQRVIPNYMLIETIKNANLTYKPDPEFINKIELDIKSGVSSGFEFPLGIKQELPFFVHRTEQGSLPVYIDYKKGRSQTLTMIRKVDGDVIELQKELITLLHQQVNERVGRLETKGNHIRLVLLYLRSLGF
jgi:hypothetical protein